MRTIIHDLDDISFLDLSGDRVLCGKDIKNCIGCFKCWTYSDTCCLNDNCYDNGKLMLNSDELIIISRCINGCYESDVKKIIERSISYVEPYFKLVNNEIHHKEKNTEKIDFTVYFYGKNMTEIDKKIACRLVERNHINLHTKKPNIIFVRDYKEIKI